MDMLPDASQMLMLYLLFFPYSLNPYVFQFWQWESVGRVSRVILVADVWKDVFA